MDKDYTINIKEEGSDKVIRAFNNVANAEDKATQGATDLGNASANAQSKMSKLGQTLKDGAGAAAGVAAGAVGLATALNDNLSPGASKAIGALSAFSGVASAFGPAGQLVATGASLAAAAIALFSDDTDDATESMNNFNANSNPFLASWEKIKNAAKSADDAVSSYKSAIGLSGLSDKFILGATPDQVKKAQELSQTIRERTMSLVSYQALAVKASNFDEKAATKRIADLDFEIAQQEALGTAMGQSYSEGATKQLKGERDAAADLATEGINLANSKSLIAGKARELSKELVKAQAELERLTDTSAKPVNVKQSWLVEYQKAVTEGLVLARAAAAELRSEEQLILHQNPTPDWQIAYYDELDQRRRESADAFAAIQSEEQATLHQTKGDYDDFASTVGGKAVDALDTFGASFAQTAVAALLAGESFKEVANQALASLASQALGEAAFQTAKGLAYLAANFFFPSPNLSAAAATAFASAAAFGAIGGIAAGATVATGGFSGGSGGGSAGSGGSAGDLGPSGGSGGGGPTQNTYIIQNTGVIGLDRDLDRRFAEGTRREQQRPGGIRQRR